MRVLLVDLETVWRGGQSQALLLLQGLRRRGHQAELVSTQNSALAERTKADGFRVHTCAPIFRRAQAAGQIRKLLRMRRFDVIHANEAHALTAAWLARAHRQTPLLVSRRVAFPLSKSVLGTSRYAAAKRVVAISHFVAKSVIASGIPADFVEVVYDGVEIPQLPDVEARTNARRRWKISDESTLIGCVGYLLPEKGQESIIRALPIIRQSIPNCRLVLAGNGPCRAGLEILTRQLGMESAVKFLGHVEDISEIYEMLDLFVFPSLAEPLGSSLLSAMSYGLPVIAMASGGVPEVVNDNCGILLASTDPAMIAEAVISLANNPETARRLGSATRERIAQNFTSDHMVDSTLKVYSNVTGEHPHTS